MKRIISLILIPLICLSLVSCNFHGGQSDVPALSPYTLEQIDDSSIIFGNSSLKFDYTEEEYSSLMMKIDSLESRIKNSDDAEELLEDFNSLEDVEISRLSNQCSIANILMGVYSCYERYSKQSISVNEKYNTVTKRIYSLYKMLYDDEKYREVFFSDWQQDDIDYMLKMSEHFTDEVIELEKKGDLLKEEYYALMGKKDFIKKSSELYIEVVENNKKIAKAMGYDNYMDYAYDYLYGREYSPVDTDYFKLYVKKYIVPSVNRILEAYRNTLGSITNADLKSANRIINSQVSDFMLSDADKEDLISGYICEYFASLDDEVNSCYDKMLSDGNYVIAQDQDISDSGAFTTHTGNSAICYFGPGYHNLYTFIHEYGHYHAITYSESMNYSLDLHEVQSQGNEWLFTSFLKSKIPTKQYEYISLYNLLDNLCIILRALSVNEFEKYVYTHDDYTAKDLDRIMADILKEMGAYDIFKSNFEGSPTEYWHYVTVDNPGYYISYAVSLIPSLNLYYESLYNYDVAAEQYLKLSRVDTGADFKNTVINAGLADPFSENAFIKIMLLCR